MTETELYGRKRRPKRVKARFGKEGIKLSDFGELAIGDYVVHINHGIGRNLGIKKLEIGGAEREYLEIEYADQDRLFVPTDQLNLIQKYIGFEENPPRINRLGVGIGKVKNVSRNPLKKWPINCWCFTPTGLWPRVMPSSSGYGLAERV